MAIFDSLSGLFKRARTIEDIQVDELKREKIRLDQEEAKIIREVDSVEGRKRELFLRGKDESSHRQQMIIARKIKELDVKASNLDRQLKFISRQLRMVNGFMQLKENQKTLRESGLIAVLGSMDIEKLQEYVERSSIDGVFQMDKFEEILGTLEEGEVLTGNAREDEDVLEIMRLMQQAKESESSAEAVEESFEQVNRLLSKERSEQEPDLGL
jgi:hypothetical protein